MVDRTDVGSWLNGPGGKRRVPDDYPGRRLGMPERGPGSIARFGRRLVAVTVDWFLCDLIATGFTGYHFGQRGLGSFEPLAVFALMNLLLVGTLGSTIGQRLLGIRVVRLGGASAGPIVAAIRTLMLAVVIPSLIWDRDTRGFHDKSAGSVTVRT